MNKSTTKSYYNDLLMNQIVYVENFLPTSEFFEKKGFYEKVVKFVNLNQNENIIIDIGCGDCRLIHRFKKLKKDMTIIGIDINPIMLMLGEKAFKRLGHKVNMHYGVDITIDSNTNKLTLVSDIITQKQSFKFDKNKINLLQEDIRFAEVLRERLKQDLELADVITYTLPGGFSPHIILERGKKNYNSVRAGLEMNTYVLAIGCELLKINGRMILGIRVGSQNLEKMLTDINLGQYSDILDDILNLSKFKDFYKVDKVEMVHIDEQKEKRKLKLNLPAYAIDNNVIRYSDDIKKIKNDMKLAILLIEVIKIREIPC